MPYVRPGAVHAISPDTVAALARAAGMEVPQEDLGPLARMLADQLASAEALEDLDGDGADPLTPFDPRWPARAVLSPSRS